jgi:hypothetical protein
VTPSNDSRDRVPQLNDTVVMELRLPPTTEEWAEDLLRETGDLEGWTCDRTPDALIVRYAIGGNCNALVNAQGWLGDLAEALNEGEIDPMEFTLTARAVPR